ncbi:MAG: serine/threonine protein kinase [Verrucomicrobiota bacterium]
MKTFGQFRPPIWVLPLAFAGLVALFGWWGNGQLRATIQGELRAQLAATLNANVTALGIWSTNQARLAMALADDSTVRRAANVILQSPPVRREGRPLPEMQTFVDELRPRLAELGYGTGQLVDTNLVVRANSVRPQLGGNNMVSDAHTNKFALLLATGQPVIITPFRPELLTQQRRVFRNMTEDAFTNGVIRQFSRRAQAAAARRRGDRMLMQVAAPMRDYSGVVVGALALIIDPEKEFSRILTVARSGRTGETYAFDQTGLMISRSRFDKQLRAWGLLDATNSSAALNVRLYDPGGDLTQGFKPAENETYARPLTRLAASAINGEDEVDVRPSRDYRGVPVVGACRWLPQFGFGVVTQIDADEAYRPLRVLQLVFVVLVLSLLLCATGMFVFSYANLEWRQRLNAMELKLKQLGQYTLEEKVGEGGMGVVYRAKHALLRRDTAVKLLLPGRADDAAVARFEREVFLTCQLTHPNTIQVYDYGHTPEGIFYYAMEYLRGVNLHDLVMRFGPQPEGRVIHILAQICASLAEAHGLGLIHRDIKPGNVFLCRRGGVADCVKVLDFGLVRDFRAAEPEKWGKNGERVVEGTPWFMPPEAVEASAPTDPRSDLYSMGALGYYLLTRSYIFDAETIEEVQEKQLNCSPVPPTQRTANPISPAMEQLLLTCLEKDMAKRPQTANELRALLLSLPAAAEWTCEAAASWWDAYEAQLAPTQDGARAGTPASMPAVNVDLASRME